MWFRPPTQIAQFAQPVQLVQLAQFVALVNVIASTFLLSLRVKRAHTSLVDNACSAWAFTTNLEQLASACGARSQCRLGSRALPACVADVPGVNPDRERFSTPSTYSTATACAFSPIERCCTSL